MRKRLIFFLKKICRFIIFQNIWEGHNFFVSHRFFSNSQTHTVDLFQAKGTEFSQYLSQFSGVQYDLYFLVNNAGSIGDVNKYASEMSDEGEWQKWVKDLADNLNIKNSVCLSIWMSSIYFLMLWQISTKCCTHIIKTQVKVNEVYNVRRPWATENGHWIIITMQNKINPTCGSWVIARQICTIHVQIILEYKIV